MSAASRVRRSLTTVLRALLALAVVILVLVGVAIAAVESAWGKNQLRQLAIRQANERLTATLDIGALGGSFFSGVELRDVRLTRDGRPIVSIDEVTVSYSLRELWEGGTRIRRVAVRRPRVMAAKNADGRWNLASLVKVDESQPSRPSNRLIAIDAIEVVDADVTLADPLQFGAAHVPRHFGALNALFAFHSAPAGWIVDFDHASWVGGGTDLTVDQLAGAFGRGPAGWRFDRLSVRTPRSAFVLDGRVVQGDQPTRLDLTVRATRFAFQEWSGVLNGLTNIAVEATFDTTLRGPLKELDTRVRFSGTGGGVDGALVMDTTVPGWHGKGAIDVAKLDLARWLNRPDRPSDITGRVTFDLDFGFGEHFPRGTYAFDGAHAMYLNYAADNLKAAGRLTAAEAQIDRATGVAYGSTLSSTTGAIGLAEPFPFRFAGSLAGLDLRAVPESVPVPRVESTLAFDYTVEGRFTRPFITGRASFASSEFLGAAIGAGTVGTIDTSSTPVRYSGDGDVSNMNLHRLGAGLEVAWLQDPRYEGTLSGRFRVEGSGGSRETLTLESSGRISRAELFKGTILDADVTLHLERGSLASTFDGRFTGIDPAVPFADDAFAATLSGSANVKTSVQDLLVRTPAAADYRIDGQIVLQPSAIRGFQIDTGAADGMFAGGTLTLARLEVESPALSGNGSGVVAVTPDQSSDFRYDVRRADLAALRRFTGGDASGVVSAHGRLTGPSDALRAAGDATASDLDADQVHVVSASGTYDVTVPLSGERLPAGYVTAHASSLTVSGQALASLDATATMTADRTSIDATITQTLERSAHLTAAVALHREARRVDLLDLGISLGSLPPWHLVAGTTPPVVTWSNAGLDITPATFAAGSASDQRVDVSGSWRTDGNGALRVRANHVALETLQTSNDRPSRYGGILDADAVITGTRAAPAATGTITITNGRVDRATYQQLAGRVGFTSGRIDVDLRLDQGPGVWLTAKGSLPLGLLDETAPGEAIDLAIVSSPIDLALLGGVTDVVEHTSGQLRVDVRIAGERRDPKFDGTVGIDAGAFTVSKTGAKYHNARAAFRLDTDRVTVDSFHVEDEGNHSLDVTGSLGTSKLRVGDLALDVTANRFEVLRNMFGRVDVSAKLNVTGDLESPRMTGDVTMNGDTLKVDEILERALLGPYATQATAEIDPLVQALNPWSRLNLDVSLHVPKTLRLTGTNVQVATGAPIGLGDINLRVGGDLYLYKGSGTPLVVNGSLDSVSGTYSFQGRRFNIDEANSSINFVGDLDPNLFVRVTRVVSGVEARVTVTGTVQRPELQLASTPPLDQSDILSLIVFNTTPNDLTANQQQELAVRAGALAAGFLAAPLLSAVQNDLGLEAFDIEPTGDFGNGPKVTVGQELAPGLIARFSRQFGQGPFDEVSVEYYLSRLLSLRATFSDAQSLTAISPFRRVERAGIDLLFFFSF